MEEGKKVSIGEECMISFDVDIRNSDAHSIIDKCTKTRVNHATDIVIGNRVWISAHTQILKNSVINENSIIGARTVVSGEVPSNVVTVGIPAKVRKKNVYWLRERI